MKLAEVAGLGSVLCLGVLPLAAGDTNQVEQLQKQLEQMQKNFEKTVLEQRLQIEALSRQIDELKKNMQATNARPAGATAPLAGTATNAPPAISGTTNTPALATVQSPPVLDKKPWSPAEPIRLAGGQQSYLNLSLDAMFAVGGASTQDFDLIQPGATDPHQNGFNLQEIEMTLDGKVDPYFRGQASVSWGMELDGSTSVELEEAYAETMSLPWNLQVKGGLYLTQFGRLNPTHAHTWSFVDDSLVNALLLGPDGLSGLGAQISWLAPTPFYSELFLSVQDSSGEKAFSFGSDHDGQPYLGRLNSTVTISSADKLLYVPRYAASFDLTPSQTLLVGASAAIGPNGSGSDTYTHIYGVDVFWKWKPADQHGGFPFVTWQTEAMLRQYQAGAFTEDTNGNGIIDPGEPDLNHDGIVQSVPKETLTNWGMYSQVAYGFHKGWVAALRGDYVTPTGNAAFVNVYGFDPEWARRWRLSPNLTWYPSEFSKIRLQYDLNRIDTIGYESAVWMQFEFLLGAHAAHKF